MPHICPCCESQNISIFYNVNNVPVHSCAIKETQEEALNFPRGDISLGFCNSCGFISNVAFRPSKLDYFQPYEDQQNFSPTFNIFARDLAEKLIKKYDLYEKEILEIGCGKGDFLVILSELGNNQGIGIDPAVIEERIPRSFRKRLTFIKDKYSEKYSSYQADLICCRHTLEHIENPFDFLRTIRKSIDDKPNTIVFFEVPDVTRILSNIAFEDVYYEHCSYFSPMSLARLFRATGYEVIEMSRGFQDQYFMIEAKPVKLTSKKRHNLEENIQELQGYVKKFEDNHQTKLDYWRSIVEENYKRGKNISIWGTGSKCVSFMTTLRLNKEINLLIDINPHRQGRFLPSIGKEIMPPETLKKKKPDLTIIMNPIYQLEIKKMLNDLGVNTELVTL